MSSRIAMQGNSLSHGAATKLIETESRMRTINSAQRLWEQSFSATDKDRLGVNFTDACQRHGFALGMWRRLHGCTHTRALIDSAHAVGFLHDQQRQWLLRETGELLDANDAYVDAIGRNTLVLNSLRREIFWQGNEIEYPWFEHEAKWAFMWVLATHSKAGLAINHRSFGEPKAISYVSKTKSAISNQVPGFPISLSDAIKPEGRHTQRLDVPADQIRLFEHHVGGEIREWFP